MQGVFSLVLRTRENTFLHSCNILPYCTGTRVIRYMYVHSRLVIDKVTHVKTQASCVFIEPACLSLLQAVPPHCTLAQPALAPGNRSRSWSLLLPRCCGSSGGGGGGAGEGGVCWTSVSGRYYVLYMSVHSVSIRFISSDRSRVAGNMYLIILVPSLHSHSDMLCQASNCSF